MYNADPARLRPLSPIEYIGYGLLFMIPLAGLICAIILSLKSRNINLRCYCRAFVYVCCAGIVLLSAAALYLFSRGQLAAIIRRSPSAFKVLFP